MKIRDGFVSNSSSSSFIVRKKDLTEEQITKFQKYLNRYGSNHENDYYENDDFFHGDRNWNGIDGGTEHMDAFLARMGLKVFSTGANEGDYSYCDIQYVPETEEEFVTFITRLNETKKTKYGEDIDDLWLVDGDNVFRPGDLEEFLKDNPYYKKYRLLIDKKVAMMNKDE